MAFHLASKARQHIVAFSAASTCLRSNTSFRDLAGTHIFARAKQEVHGCGAFAGAPVAQKMTALYTRCLSDAKEFSELRHALPEVAKNVQSRNPLHTDFIPLQRIVSHG